MAAEGAFSELSRKLTRILCPLQNDSFVAQDHFILACVQDSSILSILKEAGTTPDAIKTAAQQVRGGKQVNSRGAEEGFEALKKYAVDMTAEAEEGRLDPVIGRDAEIRRCIRILSRRTKSKSPCLPALACIAPAYTCLTPLYA